MKSNVNKRLQEELRALFGKAGVGDFSGEVSIPDTDDFSAELATGVHILMDAVRFSLDELNNVNLNLEKRIQERVDEQKVLFSLTQEIIQSKNLDEALQIVMKTICSLIGWDFGEVWERDSSASDRFSHSDVWYAHDVGLEFIYNSNRELEFEEGQGVIGRVAVSGKLEWIEDVKSADQESFIRRDLLIDSGAVSIMASPIVVNGKVTHVLGFISKSLRRYKTNMADFMSHIALQIGPVIQRIQLEEKLSETNEQLNRLYNNAPDMFASIDPQTGLILRCNNTLSTRIGKPIDQILGQHISMIYHPDSQSELEETISKIRSDGKISDTELILLGKEGEKIEVLLNVSTIYNEIDEALSNFLILRDVSSLRAAQRLQKRSEIRYETISRSAIDAVIVIDKKGTIIGWNEAAESHFGHSTTEAIGQPVSLIIPDNLHEAHKAGFNRFLKTEEARLIGKTTEILGKRKDGSEIPIEISLSHWKEDDQPFFMGVIRDITERKHAQQKLEEKTLQLEKSNRELEQFAYVASHDLQEPLRKIEFFTERAKAKVDKLLDEKSADYMVRTVKSVHRMQSLIDDLLELSKVISISLDPQPVKLDEVIQEVVESLELKIQKLDATIEIKSSHAILGNYTLLSQLFQNLISNSLKFHREDVPPIITIESTNDGNLCVITVSDNGIGFKNEYAEDIFSPFRRLHSKAEYEGTGIGLAICQKIVEQHGGSISAQGKPEGGALFTIELEHAGT